MCVCVRMCHGAWQVCLGCMCVRVICMQACGHKCALKVRFSGFIAEFTTSRVQPAAAMRAAPCQGAVAARVWRRGAEDQERQGTQEVCSRV